VAIVSAVLSGEVWSEQPNHNPKGVTVSDDTSVATPSEVAAGVITKLSSRSVADTVARLKDAVEGRGMRVFTVIDHSGAAEAVGLELRDTKVVMFGNPKGGTPAMVEVPLVALDLPLKVLVWADGSQTKLSYTAPGALAARYGLGEQVAAPLAGIDAVTDAVVEA
jgi:uncharacterized protein (DUF302 family)